MYNKISEVINIDETDCVLLTSCGCIIPDKMIQTGDKWQLWTNHHQNYCQGFSYMWGFHVLCFCHIKENIFFLVDSLQYSIDELMVATWNLSTELGCGGFVKVFLANDLWSNGTKVPVKVLSKVICNICFILLQIYNQ